MKNKAIFFLSVCVLFNAGCKKKDTNEPETEDPFIPPAAVQNQDNYSSLADFYARNAVPLQTFTFDPAHNASFVTAKNTTINIPANAFFFGSGKMTLEFKDIYKKSDMLLSKMGTMMWDGKPLKSSGEFFIKALNGDNPVHLAPEGKVEVLIPFNEPADKAMEPFNGLNDTIGKNIVWQIDPNDQLLLDASNYVFSLYQFKNPLSSGTWCNSDNRFFFAAYPQTTLTIMPEDTGFVNDVFLVFKNVNSMIHVYKYWSSENYIYEYAPVGLECTVVAIAVKGKKLYSSFTPITISNNQTLKFKLNETTTDDFKKELKKLDGN